MSGYERSKAPLALMEQIIMILVFALGSAICLQAFVYANQLSKTDEQRQNAMTMAEQLTEYCKADRGDLEKVCDSLQGEMTEDGMRRDDPERGMRVSLHLTDQTDYMQKARVVVATLEGEEIYSIHIAWQRGGHL